MFRKEKKFLIENRQRLEKEFAAQRERQFEHALDREGEILRIQNRQKDQLSQIKSKGKKF